MPTLTRIKHTANTGKPKQEANQSRGGNADTQWYRQVRWRTVRALHLQGEPLCRTCKSEKRLTPAVMVDHIVPVKAGGQRYDEDNLQSLCDSCHAKKSQSEGM